MFSYLATVDAFGSAHSTLQQYISLVKKAYILIAKNTEHSEG